MTLGGGGGGGGKVLQIAEGSANASINVPAAKRKAIEERTAQNSKRKRIESLTRKWSEDTSGLHSTLSISITPFDVGGISLLEDGDGLSTDDKHPVLSRLWLHPQLKPSSHKEPYRAISRDLRLRPPPPPLGLTGDLRPHPPPGRA
ncbi:hypothetical protein QTO34_006257 [Cnephaeus nilssonii]|uniref:Uncharacterized protein n=1 Tax=Cnephaeus nilssonii TaxID=3371016 RepID=A0AA40LJG3_CNENI|nr:hypothetical protein QTO34_006257 [Eptesicus nilssonii]